MRLRTLFNCLISCLAITGCAKYQHSLPQATPVPPSVMQSLPQRAEISCSNDPDLDQGSVVVWELPGVEPSDPDSAYMGARGKRLGSLPSCTVVKVTDYAWSETDEEFWVYVEAADLEGWIALRLLDFVP